MAQLKQECPTLDAVMVGNFSFFHADKKAVRRDLVEALARDNGVTVCYCNAVGIGDIVKNYIVYEGGSWVFNRFGYLLAKLPEFVPRDLIVHITDIPELSNKSRENVTIEPREERMWGAILYAIHSIYDMIGLDAMVALSGGLDSAIVATACSMALGRDRVRLVTMPSHNNGAVTLGTAAHVAKELDIPLCTASVELLSQAVVASLADGLEVLGLEDAVASNNMVWTTAQAVGRAVLGLAACHIVNTKTGRKYGLCATGNHTENLLKWFNLNDPGATGVFAPLGDMTKTEEFQLARWINQHYEREIIPEDLFNGKIKPKAELPDADDDPWDYYLMSGICAEIVRKRKTPTQLLYEFRKGLLTAEYFPHGKVYEYEEVVFRLNVETAWKRSKISVAQQAQSAPVLVLGPRSRGFASREPNLNFYEG